MSDTDKPIPIRIPSALQSLEVRGFEPLTFSLRKG